jgi:hypothetical protein
MGYTTKVRLFFDQESHRLLKTEFLELGGGFSKMLHAKYGVVSGIPIAHQLTWIVDGEEWSKTEITEFKIADKLADKLFEKP